MIFKPSPAKDFSPCHKFDNGQIMTIINFVNRLILHRVIYPRLSDDGASAVLDTLGIVSADAF